MCPTIFLKKLTYQEDTGYFVWTKTGRRAGSVDTNGYRVLSVGTRQTRDRCYEHQLAWYDYYGVWPNEIDHINGIKSDNRIINLRNVSHKTNNQNTIKPRAHNKTGYLGVTYSKERNKYYASISYNSCKKYLGTFKTPQEAHEAYLLFKREYHVGCTL